MTQDQPQLYVGAKVFVFDQNRRVYGKDRSSPIFREHFRETAITGETQRSWIIGHGTKVPKSDPWRTLFTAEMIEEAVWAKEHRWKIRGLVENVSVDQLRQIAAIIGYEAEEEKADIKDSDE